MKKSKHTFAIVALALALLLVSSPFIGFSSSTAPTVTASTVNTSSVPASVSQTTDYGDIMQYDWPQAQSDEGFTGFNPGPAPGRANVLWSVSTSGYGMVSVFDGKAFVVSFFGGTLYAYDAFNGSLLYSVGAAGTPSPNTVNPTFKLDDTYLLTQGSGGMVCREIETGEVVWSVSVPDASPHPGSAAYFSGRYSTSMKMYITTAFNTTTLQAQVKGYDLSDPSTEPPLAWTYIADASCELLCCGDGKVFLGTTEGGIDALDRNGTRVWHSYVLGGIAQQAAIYYNHKLYVSAVNWQVTCFDGETGKILWQTLKGIRGFSAYRGTAGYGMIFDTVVQNEPHGYVKAWDAETGELIWQQPGYYTISYTTMACADGKVYTCTCDSAAESVTAGLTMPGYEFTCFDAFTGTVLWKARGINFATPSIAYGNLYGIYGGRLYCIGGDPADWNFGLLGNLENERVAVSQQGPADISTPKWEYQTGGDVFSSPAVVDGKVYFGSEDKNWYCLDAYTGEKIWNFTTGFFVRASAAVVDGKVFTGADDGYFYCLDANTGTKLWETSAGGFFPHYLSSGEGEPRSSPIVVDDRVYCGSLDGKVYCLDTADGRVLHTYATGGPIMGSPAYSDDTIYIASTDSYLYALNAADLSFKWKSFPLDMDVQPQASNTLYATATPVIGGGYVYIGGGIFRGTAKTGVDYAAQNMSTPGGGMGGGIRFFAFDAATGESIWNVSRAGNTQPFYVPLYWNGEIYAAEFFEVTAMNPTDPTSGTYSPPDYTQSNRRNGNRTRGAWLGYQIQSSVAYADDLTGPKIYVGCDIGSVYCLDPTDMSTLSVFTAGGNVPCSPAIWDGKMYIGSTTGKVYCFDDAPVVSTSIWAESSKGTECWPNETVVISGRLVSYPDELVWDMETDTYVPEESTLHPRIPNATILVTFTKPDGTMENVTATTDNKGYFNVSYIPDVAGDYTWMAWYEGKELRSHSYTHAYGDLNSLEVVTAGGETPPPTEGTPMEYVYVAVAVIAIVIIVIVGYLYMKRRKK